MKQAGSKIDTAQRYLEEVLAPRGASAVCALRIFHPADNGLRPHWCLGTGSLHLPFYAGFSSMIF